VLREFQLIALADCPRLQRIFRQYNSKGVTNTPHCQFHVRVITRYNNSFNELRPDSNRVDLSADLIANHT